jgi:hypothetical protein
MKRLLWLVLIGLVGCKESGTDTPDPVTPVPECIVGCWRNDLQGGLYRDGYPMVDTLCLAADSAGYLAAGGTCFALDWETIEIDDGVYAMNVESAYAHTSWVIACDGGRLELAAEDSALTFQRITAVEGCAGDGRPFDILGWWYSTENETFVRGYFGDGSAEFRAFGDQLFGRYGDRRGVLTSTINQIGGDISASERWTVIQGLDDNDTLRLENVNPGAATIFFPIRSDWTRRRAR